ncbi:adenomatous polyposis coli protein-like [Contarinia nasturtii]|uniref:adenomatous polyposis coli protein-like n=1 Tax=Contarinia nasturtii TaxID=265458 RepID=UPI0012D45DD9|nr:adenomatous polyposis coli protein-like [Contarinia nasturtii]
MKTIIILFLSAVLCNALAEPVRYRQVQLVRASARQTDGEVPFQTELGKIPNEESQNDSAEATTELTKSAPGPILIPQPPQAYPPQGWRPFGQLLVLPVAVRENQGNLESTTTAESRIFNDAEATEETPTTESQPPSNEELQEVETSEPKIMKTEAHKRPPTVIIIKGKKVGELKVQSKQEESTEMNETESDSSTTEKSDEATTTSDPKSENLESTLEPEAESVDVEKSNEDGKNVNIQNSSQMPASVRQSAFFIQLADGTFQRVVYVAPPMPAAFEPQSQQPASNIKIQQLNQAPNSPFGFNPITNPRIVTFSTQYNAW